MGRLTERDKQGQGIWVEEFHGNYNFFDKYGDMYPAIDKLAHYEDMEEQGKLIELPCAVGDTVYIPNERFPAEIVEIRITPQGIFAEYMEYERSYELTEIWDDGSFCIEDIGVDVFLTKEEAEAKLAELKGE